MTNLQIQMMIHYYCFCKPYASNDPEHANSIVVTEQRQALVREGLLVPYAGNESGFKITDRGRAYVDALQEMPLPVIKWVLPLDEFPNRYVREA